MAPRDGNAIMSADRKRCRIIIHGAVQGVGFRPFVYRLAVDRRLAGWVTNTPQGVIIEVEGDPHAVTSFPLEIQAHKPVIAQIHSLEAVELHPSGYASFEIRESDIRGQATAVVLPDMATCPECLREIFDPANRRYRYPFTNCTNCGPRFTIIASLPYDRPSTTMRDFVMCPACRREYDDPSDRRFHAQPNACPVCGPHADLWDHAGSRLATHWEAIERATELLRAGRTIAVKSVGGFHLVCDAANAGAVRELRTRKRREEKPFALLMPSIEVARSFTHLSDAEERVLQSPAAPIVLVERRENAAIFHQAVPPADPFLGVMLPSNPLEHLLVRHFGRPVVATSGNLTDEPICIDEQEAVRRLRGIAGAFLVHDRPILRHADDSIVRVLLGREQVLRRSRGYAPLPVLVGADLPPVLAVGAHLKNSVAVAEGRRIVIGQHIGDLETMEAFDAFGRVARDLPVLHGIAPKTVACDMHPDYRSTAYARSQNVPIVAVQHHLAHVLACMAENERRAPVLGVSWDGTGLGTDGTIWGGEFLVVDGSSWSRAATLRSFRLPGGDAAVREPRRCGLAVVHEALGEASTPLPQIHPFDAFSPAEAEALRTMIVRGVNAPLTTSVGRLFDAVAFLIGLRDRVRHEGQAAMELEWTARTSRDDGHYDLPVTTDHAPWRIDWGPMILTIIDEYRTQNPVNRIARRFHASLAHAIGRIANEAGIDDVLLTGGCFQNGLLTEMTVAALKREGHQVFWHQRIPPNDGGISAGQAYACAAPLVERPFQLMSEAVP